MQPIRIAHIDLTAFFVSVERLLHPEWVGKPIMVAGKADHRGVVTCASYEVRKFGVHAGMATAIAQRKCPIAIRVDSHHDAYEEHSRKVRTYLKQYAPVFEPASIDEFYIDWTGCEKLFGGSIVSFAEKIQKNILEQFGLPSAMGIASNKVTAKIACDNAKPYGIKEIAPGAEAAFLEPLDVKVLPGVGEVMLKQLHQFNIRTCGQLAQLTPEFVEENLGMWGLHIQGYAQGNGSHELSVAREQKQISTEETFARDTRDKKFLHQTLHEMTLKLSEILRHSEIKARCIHLKLRYADWVDQTRQMEISPTHDPAVIYKKALQLLAKADTRGLPIRLIGIGLSRFGEEEAALDLFDEDNTKREHMLKAVDGINSKFDKTIIQIGTAE
ncbi:DNA polymerase IV [bacterium]|nr:DNA polymerase IV [bacterium]